MARAGHRPLRADRREAAGDRNGLQGRLRAQRPGPPPPYDSTFTAAFQFDESAGAAVQDVGFATVGGTCSERVFVLVREQQTSTTRTAT